MAAVADPKSRPVYSTERGELCPRCGGGKGRCACRGEAAAVPADGVVRVGRETRGRRGKGVTVVSGLPLAAGPLRELAADLRRLCGTGGTVKGSIVEIQGDHRDRLLGELQRRGFRAKRAGG